MLKPQLIKHFGGNVVGTTSSPTKAAIIKEAGADHVLLTTTPAAANIKSILDITSGKGVEVVYDGVGKDTWEENFEVVRKHGTIASYGNSSGPVPPFAPLKLMPKALKLTRPMVTPFIEEPEDFERHVQWIFDAVKGGGLKVSGNSYTSHQDSNICCRTIPYGEATCPTKWWGPCSMCSQLISPYVLIALVLNPQNLPIYPGRCGSESGRCTIAKDNWKAGYQGIGLSINWLGGGLGVGYICCILYDRCY
jgi:hypothetical protein